MEKIARLYQKYRNYIEDGLFLVFLAFYPLTKINQGLDITDTCYSLGNAQYFPTAKGTWMTATYLANAVGWLLMQLPQGDTLRGMYFYTGLLVSGMALISYFALRKKIPAWIVFIGELAAVSLCWAPTTVLYQYLTYFLMGAGMLLLYGGICTERTRGRIRFCCLFGAGICLGANVAVRMPNVVQAAFILVLWYAAYRRKEAFTDTCRETLVCMAGYLTGFGIPLLCICLQYGFTAYPDMVRTMFAMTDKAVDYKPSAMITGMFTDYITGLYWLAFAGACAGILYVLYRVKEAVFPQKHNWLYGLACVGICLVLVRFYWGRGMFNFAYNEYRSIYQWAVLFLLVAIASAVWLFCNKRSRIEDNALALLILLAIFLTPLGSNNILYPIINNLFLVAPFTLWICYSWFVKTRGILRHWPWKSMLVMIIGMLLAQGIGFHTQFAFSDGIWGEKRDTLLSVMPKTAGIYTNRENAELFEELGAFAEERQFAGKEVILYGKIPGLSYLLDMPTAISSAWPDLDSYRLMEMKQDMEAVELKMDVSRPVVIVASGIAAYKGEDAKAYEWFGVDVEAYDADEKLGILLQFLDDYGYEETFCNMRYAVYE
ncbi:MAG: hypothetical protein K2P65_17015 [Lachnospiraceae bacterium]|nr:hypothetical protein [Lachnospiraceae bacterium]